MLKRARNVVSISGNDFLPKSFNRGNQFRKNYLNLMLISKPKVIEMWLLFGYSTVYCD